MPFSDCCNAFRWPSWCCLVDNLVHSEMIFGLIYNCFCWYKAVVLYVFHNCFASHFCSNLARIKRTWSSHHVSGAMAVALIILQVGALVGTLDIRPALSVLIIPNDCFCSPAFLRVCFLVLLQVCYLSHVWVSTSSFSELTCRFISRITAWLFSTYACWLSEWSLPRNVDRLISSCDSLPVCALQGASSQHFRYINCMR